MYVSQKLTLVCYSNILHLKLKSTRSLTLGSLIQLLQTVSLHQHPVSTCRALEMQSAVTSKKCYVNSIVCLWSKNGIP